MAKPVIDDPERRARLVARHALSPAHRVATVEEGTRAMTVLHATEPATVYLSLQARVHNVTEADIDAALFDERTVVKQLAMRGTLFVFPRDLLPAAWGSASLRVASQLRSRLIKDVEAGGLASDGAAWLDQAAEAVLTRLSSGDPVAAQALREELPALQGTVSRSLGKTYGGEFPIAPTVLSWLGCEGRIVRGPNTGHWRTSRPLWTTMDAWLGDPPPPSTPAHGYAELVKRWLATFGPGTARDLQWWLGSTASAVTKALADVGAVEVGLSGGVSGWVLPGDDEPTEASAPAALLLPVLDSTVMGWKERDFFLGPHAAALFDRNGNAGTTAWWDGRIVGCWVQDPDGRVAVSLLEDIGADASRALEEEAERLTAWLGGVVVGTVYPSPAMKAARDT